MSNDVHAPVIACYGYRPETGSSLAAANLAWLLASAGKRVVLMDWDFVAPAQHRFLHPFLPGPGAESSEGLLDLVVDHITRQADPGAAAGLTALHVLRYVESCDWDFPGGGTLDLMPAGRTGPAYAVNASAMDWRGFLDRYQGEAFLRSLKETLRGEYDYVLADVPAGTGDAAYVCLRYLADRVVLSTRLHPDAIDESARVAAWVGERSSVAWFPLPSRAGAGELQALEAARERARRALGPISAGRPADAYLARVEVPERAYFAARRVPPALFETEADPTSITAAHAALLEYVTDGAVTSPAVQRPPESLLQRYELPGPESPDAPLFPIAATGHTPPPPGAAPGGARPAAGGAPKPVKIFVSYSHLDGTYVGEGSLLGHLRLLEAAGLATFWYDEQIAVGSKWDDEIRRHIRESDIALVLVSQRFLMSKYIQDVEIRAFLELCETSGMIIFPVLLSSCDWELFEWLKERKFIPPPPRTLERDSGTPESRTESFHDVYKALKARVLACRAGADTAPL